MTKAQSWLTALAASAVVISALAGAPKYICGETGKELDKCCCTQKDGKLVCQETGKTLDECCCAKKASK